MKEEKTSVLIVGGSLVGFVGRRVSRRARSPDCSRRETPAQLAASACNGLHDAHDGALPRRRPRPANSTGSGWLRPPPPGDGGEPGGESGPRTKSHGPRPNGSPTRAGIRRARPTIPSVLAPRSRKTGWSRFSGTRRSSRVPIFECRQHSSPSSRTTRESQPCFVPATDSNIPLPLNISSLQMGLPAASASRCRSVARDAAIFEQCEACCFALPSIDIWSLASVSSRSGSPASRPC